jgi:hypothetical protein
MKRRLLTLIAIGVCALAEIGAKAQSLNSPNSLPDATLETGQPAVSNSEAAALPLTMTTLQAKLDEAKDLLKSQANSAGSNTVVLAVLDRETARIETVSIAKDLFLTKGAKVYATSQSGRGINVTIVRANGVNTAVRVNDAVTGKELTPLTVAYPIVKGGSLTEMAYYSSAHPGVLVSDVALAGQTYVSRMLDQAAGELETKGVHIPSDIVEIAEHLCVVEHTDHKRFMTEAHTNLLPEIVSLYALNQGNTFRYSVSTAGAGGMIQMIPRTYESIRQQHPSVPLQTDFVAGMRDHSNALKAMLLYMNDTWTNLAESSEVQEALTNGLATKAELLAAGYNSNPVRLPVYLKNGGANWKTMIPAETQMYLAIYSEVDRNIAFPKRAESEKTVALNQSTAVTTSRPARFISLLTWVNGFFARML